jgi:glycosyltransferase involved in cell wall biosynthesis
MSTPSVSPKSGEILVFLCLNDRGGAEISMLKIAQGLTLRGYPVTLAVYGSNPRLARECGFTGSVINVSAKRTVGAMVPLYRLLRGGRFSILMTAFTHTNIIATVAACLSGQTIRVVATEHGVDGIMACEASFVFASLTRLAYGRAAAVVAVSQGLARRWRNILSPQAPVVSIYNPVVPLELDATPEPPHAWLASKQVPVVIGIGRLKAEKNFALLIDAFAGVVAQRDARLVILGEGEQRSMLERLARERGVADKVLMPGFTADPDAWLAYADMLVCPSQREGFGNVIVEALALGVPVVATNCPCGPAEILDNGRYGRLVPMNDAVALTRAMVETLAEGVDKAMLAARAKDFTVASCIDLYAKLIDNQGLRVSA